MRACVRAYTWIVATPLATETEIKVTPDCSIFQDIFKHILEDLYSICHQHCKNNRFSKKKSLFREKQRYGSCDSEQ